MVPKFHELWFTNVENRTEIFTLAMASRRAALGGKTSLIAICSSLSLSQCFVIYPRNPRDCEWTQDIE